MELDGASVVVSLIVSTGGLGLLMYGKKQRRLPQMAVGMVMMAYPFFISDWMISAAIAAGLLALMVFAIRAGL
jgi:hypothetical protein